MNLRYILAHGWYAGMGSIKTSYYWLIAQLCFPLSLLFVVGVLSQGKLLPYALAGGAISIMVSNSIQSASELVSFRLENKHQDLIVATRTGPADYMLGEMLSSLSWTAPCLLLYLILDASYHLLNPYNLVMTLLVCLLVTVATLSMAFCLFSFIKYSRKVWALATIFSTLFATIAPIFYPYSYIPKSLLFALTVLPSTPAAVLEQGFFNLAPTAWYMLGVLLIETFVYLLLARYVTRWREH